MKAVAASTARLQLKPVYTVAELARMAGVDTRRMRRLLLRHGVQLHRGTGRVYTVPLSEIERKLHWLRESMYYRDLHLDIATAASAHKM